MIAKMNIHVKKNVREQGAWFPAWEKVNIGDCQIRTNWGEIIIRRREQNIRLKLKLSCPYT
jgi:hypothetical protein